MAKAIAEKREIKAGILYRTFEIDRAQLVDDKRTVELSFSSELPVERWFGYEILDHNPSSVDLSRLKNAAPLLMEHNRNDQVGVIEDARIDADKKGRATVRFGMSARAIEIFQDVKDGIRRLVSVGYRVDKLVTEKIEDEVETLRATAWTPMEISIVSVPADASVGIGRGDKTEERTVQITLSEDMKRHILMDPAAPVGGGGAPPAAPPASPPVPTPEANRSVEDAREIFAMARQHNRLDIYAEALEHNWPIEEFRTQLLKRMASAPLPQAGDPGTRARQAQSLGDLLVNSEVYRNAIKKQYSSQTRTIGVDLPGLGIRATFLTTTGLTGYERPPGIVLLEQQPLTVAQLFSQAETTMPTVRFVRETSYTQAATAVAEEGQKQEASFDLEEVDAGVKKIAVLGRVSDEMFADFPQVRDYVNQRLVFMVQSLEDNHLLNGDGTSTKITGVLSTSGIQTEAAGASANPLEAIHKAITKVRSVGFFQPDSIVMHPNDWQDARLMKDGSGQYYAGGPFGGTYGVGGYTAMGPLWGLPVVVTTAIAEGTALVGAFRLGGQLFRREGIRVETTNSDASDFAYNRICIRVEERLTLAVYRPLAFCSVTGIA